MSIAPGVRVRRQRPPCPDWRNPFASLPDESAQAYLTRAVYLERQADDLASLCTRLAGIELQLAALLKRLERPPRRVATGPGLQRDIPSPEPPNGNGRR